MYTTMDSPTPVGDHASDVGRTPGRRDGDAAVQTARGYLERILHRTRSPLPPIGFKVDWDDQPLRHTIVPGVPRLPLEPPLVDRHDEAPASLAVAVERTVQGGLPQITFRTLSDLLGCQGIVGRRLELNWNEDSTRKLHLTEPVWARPTASGGGMYPAETYLVAQDDPHLPDGVFHYDSAHHSLERLARADRTADLRRATSVAATAYLVVAVRFWKNAFKYNSFCYHVVAQDVGCLLASWRLVLGAEGAACHPVGWFDDDVVARAIGVDGQREAPFLVVPVGRTPAVRGGEDLAVPVHDRPDRHPTIERSRRVREFPLVQEVHAACSLTEPGPPPATNLSVGTFPPLPIAPVVALPPGPPGGLGVLSSLRERRSSFGLLARTRPVPLEALAEVLRLTSTVTAAPMDTLPEVPRVRLWVLNGTVDGLAANAYRFEPATDSLVQGPAVDLDELQQLYPLSNYNIGQLGALVAITVNVDAYLSAYGARGYRTAGIDVGVACQAMYVAAASHGLGAGAVLGVDTTAIDALVQAPGQERTLLCMMLGTERAPSASFAQTLHERAGGR